MRSSRSSKAEQAPAWLTERPYAHRGLHGPSRLENSRAAFEAAIGAGFGIELDVQVSRDGRAMVIHDGDLDRLTVGSGRVADLDSADLRRITLKGMGETVPALDEILDLIAGRCPLLIEVKSGRHSARTLCRDIRARLSAYQGQVAIMSFNPQVSRWFAGNAPHIARGLVMTEKNRKGVRGKIERLLALWRSRAQFLAYDIRCLPSPLAAAARSRGLALLTWTVANARDEEAASIYADQIIHELPQRGSIGYRSPAQPAERQ
jgi:glycerophosphoryl diester phosphodiesterase